MFLAHSFRLRDPWQCEATEQGARWSRVFHRPTGLEEDDELWLVISGLPLSAQVTLNGQPPPRGRESEQDSGSPPHEYRVTHLLRDSNQIEILLPTDHPLPTTNSFPHDARLGVVARS